MPPPHWFFKKPLWHIAMPSGGGHPPHQFTIAHTLIETAKMNDESRRSTSLAYPRHRPNRRLARHQDQRTHAVAVRRDITVTVGDTGLVRFTSHLIESYRFTQPPDKPFEIIEMVFRGCALRVGVPLGVES